jgi:hypothetical protein
MSEAVKGLRKYHGEDQWKPEAVSNEILEDHCQGGTLAAALKFWETRYQNVRYPSANCISNFS